MKIKILAITIIVILLCGIASPFVYVLTRDRDPRCVLGFHDWEILALKPIADIGVAVFTLGGRPYKLLTHKRCHRCGKEINKIAKYMDNQRKQQKLLKKGESY